VKLVGKPFVQQFGGDDFLNLPLEFCEGGSLKRFLSTRPFRDEVVQRIAYQVACALAHMHMKMICHRDLKADNILLTCSNLNCALVKVCDFGEARNLDERKEGEQLRKPEPILIGANASAPEKGKQEPTLIGANAAAPEALTGRYDCRMDVWSLGVLMHDLTREPVEIPVDSKHPKLSHEEEEIRKYKRPNPQNVQDEFINYLIQPASTRPSITEVLKHPFLQSYRELLLKRLQLKSRRNMILRTHFPQLAQRFIQETLEDIDNGILSFFTTDSEVQEFKGFNQVLMKI
jgi:serine/threonine protein kinase